MNDTLSQLKSMVFDAHVPIIFLAQLCKSTTTSISNYINDRHKPDAERTHNIEEGLKQYKVLVNEILNDL